MLVLNFHQVEPEITIPDRKHITITPNGLRNIIRVVRNLGLEFVSLQQVMDQGGPTEGARQALITFDDGFENVYRYGMPVLEQEECPATVFVLPGKLDGNNDWDQGALPVESRDQLMSMQEMAKMIESGWMTLGSHGMKHRPFSTLNREELEYEIFESYHFLEQHFKGAFVPVLAYPWGEYSDLALDVMKHSRYAYAQTTEKGLWSPASNRFTVPRMTALYRDGNPFWFSMKLMKFLYKYSRQTSKPAEQQDLKHSLSTPPQH
jgi:peptidoglycan/xylan/chitin deacetylase (PgdA/CDA1 family)